MATIFQRIKEYYEKEQKEREIGRYYASEVYDIVSGELKPEFFFERKKVDNLAIERMTIGQAQHEFLEKILQDHEIEKKVEIEIEKGCKIVGKIDALKDNVPKELKTTGSLERIVRPYPSHLYQLECYLRGLKECKEGWITYIQRGGWSSKNFKVRRCENRWKDIVSKVKEFHQKLLEWQKKKVK